MSRLVFVTGGARSGKSSFALSGAEAAGPRRQYIATLVPGDDEMRERVRLHRAERGEGWEVLEEPLDAAGAVTRMAGRFDSVLLDCLTLWTTNILSEGRVAADEFERLGSALVKGAGEADIFVVSNEVGMGIVPMNAQAREFRDQAGWLNQQVAALADECYLVVSGIPLRLK